MSTNMHLGSCPWLWRQKHKAGTLRMTTHAATMGMHHAGRPNATGYRAAPPPLKHTPVQLCAQPQQRLQALCILGLTARASSSTEHAPR
jgi:hypothetical protein